jgi:PAS domain S-box-containing protein
MSTFGSVKRRLREYLPGRQRLDARVWEMRHRFMLGLLWAHVPFLAAIGLAQGEDPLHVLLEVALVALPGVLAVRLTTQSAKGMAVTFGLLSASGVLVHFTGGLIESHFHYFVMVTVIALYQDWKPLLLGVGYVAVQHGTVGVIAPESVYNHFAAFKRPVLWALIHAGYILFLVVVQLSHWRLADKAAVDRRASEERFRRSFEEAPIGMAMMDLDGKFLQVNRAMGAMLGYKDEQLIGSGLMSLTHADDHVALAEVWQELKAGASASATVELRCLTFSGKTMWARIAVSTIPEQDGLAPVAIVQIEDATRAHEDRERLVSLVGGKDEYVASIATELQRPLAGALELADDYIDGRFELSPNATRELVRSMADQTREAARIVDDLVVSALAGRQPISVVARALPVDRLVGEAVAAIPGASRVSVEAAGAQVWADPDRTRQILEVLIGNAMRFGGSSVSVTVGATGPDTLIQVRDDGSEIPASEHERIFHSDLRGGAPLTQPTSVGLGLSVARYLARLMGGDVRYRRDGDMSVFEVRLPGQPPSAGEAVRHPWETEEVLTA